jgi:outer membrane protein assembly factor BamA
VVLRVEEGEPVIVRFLQFNGAGSMSDRLLSRTARFRSGTRYEPDAVSSWRRNLEQSRLVRVNGDAIVKDERGYGVRFDVTPERSSRVALAAGYVPDPGELSGFAHLGMANLMNTGRRLEVDWRSVPGQTSYYLGYTEPWVLGLWLSLTGSARHETVDTVRARTELTAAAVLAVTHELDVRFSTGYDRVVGIDTAGNGETFWAGTGFEFDSRDPVVNPARGMHLDLRTRAGTRAGADGSRFVGRFEGDWAVVGPRFRRLTVANGLHHRVVYSAAHLGESELYRLGGAGSLRGFREDEFSGGHLAWYDLELRYALGGGSVAYPFFDAGVVEDGGWTMHAGYGLGVRLATRIGMFEIDYGLRAGESPLLGRLHFGYETGF